MKKLIINLFIILHFKWQYLESKKAKLSKDIQGWNKESPILSIATN
jgi:hypothetical protein